MSAAVTTLQDQLACAQRELSMRQRVYPKWVDQEKMTKEKADKEITTMSAICDTLKARIEEKADGR